MTLFILLTLGLILYLAGIIVVYNITNKKMNQMGVVPSGEEASILLRMIILYPFFYPEIDIILKHCSKAK